MRGAATTNPAVLAIAAGPDLGLEPFRIVRGGQVVVVYQQTRLYLSRDAWEDIPPGGILVVRVGRPGTTVETYAFTLEELESVFDHVRHTRCWDDRRCYHWPKTPKKTTPYRVMIGHGQEGTAPEVEGYPGATRADPTPRREIQRHERSSQEAPPSKSTAWGAWWAGQAGVRAESVEYLERIEAWRRVWRPQRIRVLLVAESHVAECEGDLEARVRPPPNAPPGLPKGYCRLIYCLGYGEDDLCRPRPQQKNSGTWQFWDIFGATVGGTDNRQPRRTDSRTRLAWKLQTLEQMRQRGIWLVDASVVGIMSPVEERRYEGRRYQDLVRESYRRFVWPAVAADRPRQVWVIGMGVGEALRGLPGIEDDKVIPQPQSRDATRYRSELNRMAEALSTVGTMGTIHRTKS
ncbi:MAG: hypothetical protein ABIO70_11970 [Pseudomonadota bacterium]